MANTRADQFLQAKQVIRQHKDWTDEQLAEHLGLKPHEAAQVIPQARKDVEATDVAPTHIRTTIGAPAQGD
jgi:isoaspartyl peptidase/L-asparaginase-like protein (Ntn-hydrolase superfamily)